MGPRGPQPTATLLIRNVPQPSLEGAAYHSSIPLPQIKRACTQPASGPGAEPHLHGYLLGLVVEACLHQAEGKHSFQIPEDKVVKNTLRRYASVGPLVRLCTCREEHVASSGAARG